MTAARRPAAARIARLRDPSRAGSGSVGSSSAPIAASITSGGVLNGSSGPGGFWLNLGSGAGIGSVSGGSSGNYGDVYISAAGSLTKVGGGTNVSGRDITLTTSVGTIGTLASPLQIAAHVTNTGGGGFNHGVIDATAPGDIMLNQVGGTIVVNQLISDTGDILLSANGGIYDLRGQTPAQVIASDAQSRTLGPAASPRRRGQRHAAAADDRRLPEPRRP